MPQMFNIQKKPSLREKLNQSDMMIASEGLKPGEALDPYGNKLQTNTAKSLPPTTDGAAPEEPQATKEDQATAKFLTEGGDAPEPNAFSTFYKKWKSVPTEMNPSDKKMFADKLAQLDQKMLDAETKYNENKDRLAWIQAAEQLGHAMVQLMAAQDASKNNWSVGGIKFDKNNWESKFDRALKEYDSQKDTIEKQRNVVARELDKADSKTEREGRDTRNLMEKDFFTTQARIEAAAKKAASAEKDSADKERSAREKARMYIANYEAAEDAVNKLESGDFAGDKEKKKLQEEITDALRKNGHIGVSSALKEGGEGAVGKSGGFFGFFQNDDYSKMKQYIAANKKNGIKSVYRGYGVQVPGDVESALKGEASEAPAAETQMSAKAAPSASSGPKPGYTQGGYRFKGGDPANPGNWEPVK